MEQVIAFQRRQRRGKRLKIGDKSGNRFLLAKKDKKV